MVFQAPTRRSLAVFGAVRPADGQWVASQHPKFDAMTFWAFLQQLLRHRRRGRRLVLVVDNARWHHAALLQPWLRAHQSELRLDFLPAYSPQLNPVERVWKLTRRLSTHNRYFPILEDLIDAVFAHFDLWQRPNETLRRLCAIS